MKFSIFMGRRAGKELYFPVCLLYGEPFKFSYGFFSGGKRPGGDGVFSAC